MVRRAPPARAAWVVRFAIPVQRIYDIIKGRRGVTAETAILLAELFDMSPQFWMNAQGACDLWEAQQARRQKAG